MDFNLEQPSTVTVGRERNIPVYQSKTLCVSPRNNLMAVTHTDPKLAHCHHLKMNLLDLKNLSQGQPFAQDRWCFPQSLPAQHERHWPRFSSSQEFPWCKDCLRRGCAGFCREPAASWTSPARPKPCEGCVNHQVQAPASPSVRSLVIQVLWSTAVERHPTQFKSCMFYKFMVKRHKILLVVVFMQASTTCLS